MTLSKSLVALVVVLSLLVEAVVLVAGLVVLHAVSLVAAR